MKRMSSSPSPVYPLVRRQFPSCAWAPHPSPVAGSILSQLSQLRGPVILSDSPKSGFFSSGGSLRGARREDDDVWRPDLERIRAEIAAEAELELEVKVEASDGDGEKQGTKRKRAPPTKGPCEHGVKHRSRCKVCSACPHGRRRSSARSAVGHQSASTVVCALSARSAVGHRICEHGRERYHARSARSSERIINQTNIF